MTKISFLVNAICHMPTSLLYSCDETSTPKYSDNAAVHAICGLSESC